MRHTRRTHRAPATATRRSAPGPGHRRPACERRLRHPRTTGFENPGSEPWGPPQQPVKHLLVTRRWIEQQHQGLPNLRTGDGNRYRVSDVEAWLREHNPVIPPGTLL